MHSMIPFLIRKHNCILKKSTSIVSKTIPYVRPAKQHCDLMYSDINKVKRRRNVRLWKAIDVKGHMHADLFLADLAELNLAVIG